VVDGVRFYNDSKATNVQAVRAALESFDGGILLILGGRFKGGDFRDLRDLVASKVKCVFAIGESRERVRDALIGAAPVEIAADLETAVSEAHRRASPETSCCSRLRDRASTCIGTIENAASAFGRQSKGSRRRRVKDGSEALSDRTLFVTTIAIVGFGVVMLYSASSVVAWSRTGAPASSR
jgi:hypothetical protein